MLQDNGVFVSKKQPDGALLIAGAKYPFLVLEVAYSEDDKHALRKAKDYIRYSQGKIIYVIVISVYHSSDPVSIQVHSEELSAPEAGGQSTASPLPLLPLKSPIPTAPSDLDRSQRYHCLPHFKTEPRSLHATQYKSLGI